MDRHVRILAVLNIIFGLAGLFGGSLVLLFLGGFRGFMDWANRTGGSAMFNVIAAGLLIFTMTLAAPCFVTGAGLLGWKPWARVLGIVVCALNLMNFPFGTALGLYGLWVLLSEATEPLFDTDPIRGGLLHHK